MNYNPSTSIQQDVIIVINLDGLHLRVQACEQQVVLFYHVMPMSMENLAIAQHQNTLGLIHYLWKRLSTLNS
jgi:hypothetical protein